MMTACILIWWLHSLKVDLNFHFWKDQSNRMWNGYLNLSTKSQVVMYVFSVCVGMQVEFIDLKMCVIAVHTICSMLTKWNFRLLVRFTTHRSCIVYYLGISVCNTKFPSPTVCSEIRTVWEFDSACRAYETWESHFENVRASSHR